MTLPHFNWYGLMIGLGIAAGAQLASLAKKRLKELRPSLKYLSVDTLLLWITFPALVGARLYHVIDYWEVYSQQPQSIIAVWQGGLGIYGAILGTLVGVISFTAYQLYRHSSFSWSLWSRQTIEVLDLLAIGIPLGQAIGRVGNYFNQELYGLPTNLPWAIFIDESHRIPMYAKEAFYHPLFFYESLGSLVLTGILFGLTYKKLPIGFYWNMYLLGYGCLRFGLDFLRIAPWRIGIFTTSQWISLLMIILASLILSRMKGVKTYEQTKSGR